MIDYCTMTAQSHDKYILSDIYTEIKKPRLFYGRGLPFPLSGLLT